MTHTIKTNGNSAVSATTTPADLAALADQFIQQLRAMREQIPDFTLPHASFPRLSGAPARIPENVIDAALVACNDNDALRAAVDVPAIQFAQQYDKAFSALRDELKTTFEGLNYTIRSKRYDSGRASLRVLTIARSLVKVPENAKLATNIDEMENGLRRRRRPNAKAPVPPPQVPVVPGVAASN